MPKPFRRKIIPYNPILKARARKLRNNMTLGEIILWQEIKGKLTGFDFDSQRPIDHYIADFYCKDLMLIIEVDGLSHSSARAKMRDKWRQERLEALGIRFLRFDDQRVRDEVEKVVEEIKEWIVEHKSELPEWGPHLI